MQPTVTSRLPLWTPGGVSEIPDTPPAPIHVPPGSYRPLMAAVGIVIMGIGALMHHHLLPSLLTALGGVAVLVYAIYSWAFEPFEV